MSGQRLFLALIFTVAVLTNFLGIFIPETGFDALWYHLTIPKLYLSWGTITYIPGGLLYYSAMPRLMELIYMVGLGRWSFLWPHFVNFVFGLGAAVMTYKLARLFLTPQKSLWAAAIFYITPTVGWLSNSAYIDVPRTFFEVSALYLVFSRKYGWGALLLGLAISTKTLALGSIPLLGLLAILQERKVNRAILFSLGAILIALPWFVSSYLATGYPLYPIGAGILDSTHTIFLGLSHPWSFITDFFLLSVKGTDLLTPLYFSILPFLYLSFGKFSQKEKLLALLAILSYLVWWITPRTGGGRFFLPYTPLWAVLVVVTWQNQTHRLVKQTLLAAIVITVLLNCLYRIGSVSRALPIIMGQESQQQYLCRTLDFTLGVFVDCDDFFKDNITTKDLVYVQGVHNLYYLEFPFVHESWYNGEQANYLLLQGEGEPRYQGVRVPEQNLIHRDFLTRTKVYKL